MNEILSININNFRAIKNASIKLNGITVITGENGSGKSTISKLSYHTLKIASQYEKIINEQFNRDISRYALLLNHIFDIFIDKKEKDQQYIKILENFKIQNNQLNLQVLEEITNYLKTKLSSVAEKYLKNDVYYRSKFFRNEIKRTIYIVTTLLSLDVDDHKKNERIEILKSDNIEKEINFLISTVDDLYFKIKSTYDEYLKSIEERPLKYFYNVLNNIFNQPIKPETFEIKEFDIPLIDKEKDKLNEPKIINTVIYIDTPMVVGLNDCEDMPLHWKDLNDYLTGKIDNNVNSFGENTSYIQKIKTLLEKEIIQGKIIENNDQFETTLKYKRKDGKIFDLFDCATGLKSFAILQVLFNKGYLNHQTLLIIDEPEAHLHPQWVVEYARLIVLLNKYFNVKFLIASHHPDMVSAIKYISIKKEVDDFVNFYLATKDRNKSFQYSYKNTGLDLEEIFASFNIALDRMDLYGKTD